MSEDLGRAVTVTGELPADSLGVTLAHEHVHIDGSFLCTDSSASPMPIEDIPLEDLQSAPMRYLANLDMREPAIAEAELRLFAQAGGRTIIDCTPKLSQSWNPLLLQQLSIATGVNIVMGTGWYVAAAHPERIADLGPDILAEELISEIRFGDPNGIRPGVIGEIGTGDPLLPREEVVLRAVALAHLATGCPVNVHMAAGCVQAMKVLDIFQEMGVSSFGRIVLSHMDVAIDLEQQIEVIQRGAIVEYDTFGHQGYPDSRGYMMPDDLSRFTGLAALEAAGLLDSVLISHDACFRSQWRHYGGGGYTKLLQEGPDLAAKAGLGPDWFTQLLIRNPARIFGYLPNTETPSTSLDIDPPAR